MPGGIGGKVRLHQFKGLILGSLLLDCGLRDLLSVLTADDNDAVGIAYQNISRENDPAAAGNGGVDLAGTELERALGVIPLA